ncbi:MAG TPA: radical SAM protein [Methanosarcinaceae archaeon]|nr:radical SAM protein [Methanosarcinaceae archaeon]
MKVVIIDGYVDEPACLGVPPYISPYPRYIAGALREHKIPQQDIYYVTIDQLRTSPEPAKNRIMSAGLVIIIAGMTVPGKYLRASPITPGEIESIFSIVSGTKILGGPIRLGFSDEGGKTASVPGIDAGDINLAHADVEAFVYDILQSEEHLHDPENVVHRFRTVDEIARWSVNGAFIIKQHPDHPDLMCELETYRGCGRRKHCSFCTEPFYGSSDYRAVFDVVSEVSALYGAGARHFRIGRQPDLFTYHATDTGGDIPEPDPYIIESLYRGIRNVAPGLRVLHMDNANPATIAAYPEESRAIMKTIIKYHTSGDVAALGMESADPKVVVANDLKAMPEDVFEAIKLINDVGGMRGANGLPELLPGLNFVHGLQGETKNTFGMNYDFMKTVLDADLLVRRINIRQVMSFPGTPMFGKDVLVKKHKKMFLKYKQMVRKDIDLPMLRKLVPNGTILRDVMCEISDHITFGRQLGSYPLLVGIPAKLPVGRFIDVTVTGHGYRSITGIPYPLKINHAPMKLIRELPGAGKKRTAKIINGVPYENEQDFLDKNITGQDLLRYITIP